ncbi:MAG: hypothetical protein C5B53_07415 [Candidatus Melainabacteria bacterium]|nr:MAG: hypothetical protein C5B53_07415 [Candidatus Melainabacteria bacterium]
MFPKEILKKLQTYLSSQPVELTQRECSRRALDMIPHARDAHSIALFDLAKYQQVVLSVEGNQTTCGLKFASASRKFRSAVLIFRGRVLGCIFGSKRYPQQLFGRVAYDQLLAEMSNDCLIEAHPLDESLALAAGSMFHSEFIKLPSDTTLLNAFTSAYIQLVQDGRPGNIIVNDLTGLPIVTVYLFNREVVGVYSQRNGWRSSSYETALGCLRNLDHARVFASRLTAQDIQEVLPLTFALSSLGERKLPVNVNPEPHKLDGLLIRIKPVERTVLSPINRFFPGGAQSDADRAGRNSGRFSKVWQ